MVEIIQVRGLVRVEEAADWLGVSRSKVYELLNRGDLRSVKIDRSRRVPVGALHEYRQRLEAAVEGVAV